MALKLIIGICAGVGLLISGISYKFFGKTDNIVEEAYEIIIENITGFDIDFTPLTPEEKGLKTKRINDLVNSLNDELRDFNLIKYGTEEAPLIASL